MNKLNFKNPCVIPCGAVPVISETDYSKAIKPTTHPDRIADFHVLIYVLEGEIEVFEDDKRYTLTANSLFFLKSGKHHWGEKPFRKGTSWYYVHFSFPTWTTETEEIPSYQDIASRFYGTENIGSYHLTLPKHMILSPKNNIKYRMKQVVQDHNAGKLLKAALSLWEVLLACYEQYHGNNQQYDDNAKVKQIIAYLDENYHKTISHEALESTLSLSFKYLSALFKEKTGQTIKQYQLSLRFKKAVELLCETTMPIAEVSRQTGFYDEFYFSRIFKREYGISPLKYRNNYTPRI